MKFRIGLDLGVESVGWAVLKHNEKNEPCQIVDLGVRAFDAAENPKNGDSLSKDRRKKRGLRRLIQRRHERIVQLRNYLYATFANKDKFKPYLNKNTENFDVGKNFFDYIFSTYKEPVILRAKALDEKINDKELISVIYHLVRHRGFKSNRKSELKEEEGGKVKKMLDSNQKYMKEHSYRTIGEMFFKDEKYVTLKTDGKNIFHYRNKEGKYDNCVLRSLLEDELKQILDKQQQYNKKITNDFKNKILELFNKQRNYDEGPYYFETDPNKNKYSANYKIGNCLYEPIEKRAPRNSFSAEYFALLQDLMNLSILTIDGKMSLRNYCDEKNINYDEIINYCLSKEDVKFAQLRKKLNLLPSDRFVSGKISYLSKKKKSKEEKKNKEENNTKEKTNEEKQNEIVTEAEKVAFCKMKGTYAIQKILKLNPVENENYLIFDEIVRILINAKSDDKRKIEFEKSAILKSKINDEQLEELLELNFDKVIHLSQKALIKIIPLMKKGQRYDEAVRNAGYIFSDQFGSESLKQKKISFYIKEGDKFVPNQQLFEDLENITSPVIKRTISQTIKVLNAIIDKYGSPTQIHIETTRELKKSFEERRKIVEFYKENEEKNERIRNELITKFHMVNPKAIDIVKYKLYLEQDGKCAYSGKSFENVLGSVSAIFSNNETQIDHIIPYSLCFDDSYNNKVLVLANENVEKGNRIPFEYFGENVEKWNNFEKLVHSQYSSKGLNKKAINCLRKELTLEDLKGMSNSLLNDTSSIALKITEILRKHLKFETKNNNEVNKKPVRNVGGIITSFLRKIWGLSKNREQNDLHHAQDAVVIALAEDSLIQKISRYELTKDKYKIKDATNKIFYIDIETGEKLTKEEHFLRFGEAHINRPVGFGETKETNHFIEELNIRLNLKENKDFEVEKAKLKEFGYSEQDLMELRPIFVSRMPNRKAKGQIHKDTISSDTGMKAMNGNFIYANKKSIGDLKYKDGEIVGAQINYIDENGNEGKTELDKLVYNALINRVKDFDYNFSNLQKEIANKKVEPVYKTPSGKKDENYPNAPQIKSIKIYDNASGGFKLENIKGISENASIFRIDIYSKIKNGKKQYYYEPIYLSDVYAKKELKNQDEFCFSLFKNDLIRIKEKNRKIFLNTNGAMQEMDEFVYYNRPHGGIAITRIYFKAHDRSIKEGDISIQNLNIFEKYTVDVLGNISKKAVCEKRIDLNKVEKK